MYLFLSFLSNICNKLPNVFADALDHSDVALVMAIEARLSLFLINDKRFRVIANKLIDIFFQI